ncbi:MAG: hypothetical protein KDE03_14155 [Rhodobacteraceae bacterium]|nr:hypothetical protein [Paracoccaceae bacterium]
MIYYLGLSPPLVRGVAISLASLLPLRPYKRRFSLPIWKAAMNMFVPARIDQPCLSPVGPRQRRSFEANRINTVVRRFYWHV